MGTVFEWKEASKVGFLNSRWGFFFNLFSVEGWLVVGYFAERIARLMDG